MAGYCCSRSTAVAIASTTRPAASGLSREMYAASASRFARARRSHLVCTAGPLFKGARNVFIAGEVFLVGFGYALLYLMDLPVVQRNVFSNGFRGYERTRTAHCARQAV